jgi:hypothetical protein
MRRTVRNNILKMAVGQQIFCRGCRRILDVKTSVLVESAPNEGYCAVFCRECAERIADVIEKHELTVHPYIPSRAPKSPRLSQCRECGCELYTRDHTVRGLCGFCLEDARSDA